MSDSPSAFRSKTEAMIARAIANVDGVARRYVMAFSQELVYRTPGEGFQKPGTDYLPTGQLRGGWSASTEKVEVATVSKDGPRDLVGNLTIEVMDAQVEQMVPLPRMIFLQNNVEYASILHDGRGRFQDYARPWVQMTAQDAPIMLAKAQGGL